MIARRFLPAAIEAKVFVDFAQKYAKERVVLKRPLTEPEDTSAIKICRGKTARFEVFPGKYKPN